MKNINSVLASVLFCNNKIRQYIVEILENTEKDKEDNSDL